MDDEMNEIGMFDIIIKLNLICISLLHALCVFTSNSLMHSPSNAYLMMEMS